LPVSDFYDRGHEIIPLSKYLLLKSILKGSKTLLFQAFSGATSLYLLNKKIVVYSQNLKY